MTPVPVPKNEIERLHLLHELDILDSEPEPVFDKITQFAQQLFQVEAAIITLVDSERQWFKSKIGFNENETPREVSMCAHAVAHGSTMVVADASKDQRFSENPYVACEGGIRFYAGVPIAVVPNVHIGTLCIVDSHVRELSAEQQQWR